MKKILLLVYLGICFCWSPAQNCADFSVSVLTDGELSRNITAYETGLEVVEIQVLNSGPAVQVGLALEARVNGNPRALTKQGMNIPINLSPGFNTFTYQDLGPYNSSTFSYPNRNDQSALSSGLLEPGQYEVCITLVLPSGQQCPFGCLPLGTITDYTPPTFVFPISGDSLPSSPFLVQWSPVSPFLLEAEYELRIYERPASFSGVQTVLGMLPIFESGPLQSTSLLVSPTQLALDWESGLDLVVTVSATDGMGMPIGDPVIGDLLQVHLAGLDNGARGDLQWYANWENPPLETAGLLETSPFQCATDLIGEGVSVILDPGESLNLGQPDGAEGIRYLWFDHGRQLFREGPEVVFPPPVASGYYYLMCSDSLDHVSMSAVGVQVRTPFKIEFDKYDSYLCARPVPLVQPYTGLVSPALALEVLGGVDLESLQVTLPEISPIYSVSFLSDGHAASPAEHCIRINTANPRMEVVEVTDGFHVVQDSFVTHPPVGIFGTASDLIAPCSLGRGEPAVLFASGAAPAQPNAYGFTGFAWQAVDADGDVVAEGVDCCPEGFENGTLVLEGFNATTHPAAAGSYTVYFIAENTATFPGLSMPVRVSQCGYLLPSPNTFPLQIGNQNESAQ